MHESGRWCWCWCWVSCPCPSCPCPSYPCPSPYPMGMFPRYRKFGCCATSANLSWQFYIGTAHTATSTTPTQHPARLGQEGNGGVGRKGGRGGGNYFDFGVVRGDAEADQAVRHGQRLVHVDACRGQPRLHTVRGIEPRRAGADDRKL